MFKPHMAKNEDAPSYPLGPASGSFVGESQDSISSSTRRILVLPEASLMIMIACQKKPQSTRLLQVSFFQVSKGIGKSPASQEEDRRSHSTATSSFLSTILQDSCAKAR